MLHNGYGWPMPLILKPSKFKAKGAAWVPDDSLIAAYMVISPFPSSSKTIKY